MTDNTNTTENLSNIEDAAAVRWLGKVLAPARARNVDGPSDEVIDRIRMRVMGEPATHKRTLAA